MYYTTQKLRRIRKQAFCNVKVHENANHWMTWLYFHIFIKIELQNMLGDI